MHSSCLCAVVARGYGKAAIVGHESIPSTVADQKISNFLRMFSELHAC